MPRQRSYNKVTQPGQAVWRMNGLCHWNSHRSCQQLDSVYCLLPVGLCRNIFYISSLPTRPSAIGMSWKDSESRLAVPDPDCNFAKVAGGGEGVRPYTPMAAELSNNWLPILLTLMFMGGGGTPGSLWLYGVEGKEMPLTPC